MSAAVLPIAPLCSSAAPRLTGHGSWFTNEWTTEPINSCKTCETGVKNAGNSICAFAFFSIFSWGYAAYTCEWNTLRTSKGRTLLIDEGEDGEADAYAGAADPSGPAEEYSASYSPFGAEGDPVPQEPGL